MSFLFNFGRKKNKEKSKDKGHTKSNTVTDGFHSNGNAASGHSLADAIIFPEQYNNPTYSIDSFPDELLFIPYHDDGLPRKNPSNLFSRAKQTKLNHKYGVSALLIHGNPKNNPTHFMILFHGNGVDLGMASAIWRPLIRALPIHLLIVEYPGYGIMDGKCTCKQVIKVAEHTYKYVTSPIDKGGLGINTEKLIILGRSIGTGPASHIAKRPCHTLILVSPFTSIHNLSYDLMGKWAKWILPKDYQNCSESSSELSSPDILQPLTDDMEHEEEEEEDDDDDEQQADVQARVDRNDVEEEEEPQQQHEHVQAAAEGDEHSSDSVNTKQTPMRAPFVPLEKSRSNPYPVLSPRNDAQNESKSKYTDFNKNNVNPITKVISLDDNDIDIVNISNPTDDDEEKEQQKDEEHHKGKGKENATKYPNLGTRPLAYSQAVPIDAKKREFQRKKQRNRSKSQRTFGRSNGKETQQQEFVFNNVTQIDKWQCQNFMVFHGKNDELIPYAHTNTIVDTIKAKKPHLHPKKFLMDGVGHNDVNIQFIGLRIFMQYQDELQPSFSNDSSCIDLSALVTYLDNPPQFDIVTNKVQNFNPKPKKSKRKNNWTAKLSPSVCEVSDGEEEQEKQPRHLNEWDVEKGQFIRWQRNLPTKVYDLSLKLKLDSQQEQIEKATNVIRSKWI